MVPLERIIQEIENLTEEYKHAFRLVEPEKVTEIKRPAGSAAVTVEDDDQTQEWVPSYQASRLSTTEKVVDQQRRDAINNRLSEIYLNSEWYAARYAAFGPLFLHTILPPTAVLPEAGSWFRDLEKEMDAKDKMVKAVYDLNKIYTYKPKEIELLPVYMGFHEFQDARNRAGKLLGYGWLKRLWHEARF